MRDALPIGLPVLCPDGQCAQHRWLSWMASAAEIVLGMGYGWQAAPGHLAPGVD
jgi:hypothetical protein